MKQTMRRLPAHLFADQTMRPLQTSPTRLISRDPDEHEAGHADFTMKRSDGLLLLPGPENKRIDDQVIPAALHSAIKMSYPKTRRKGARPPPPGPARTGLARHQPVRLGARDDVRVSATHRRRFFFSLKKGQHLSTLPGPDRRRQKTSRSLPSTVPGLGALVPLNSPRDGRTGDQSCTGGAAHWRKGVWAVVVWLRWMTMALGLSSEHLDGLALALSLRWTACPVYNPILVCLSARDLLPRTLRLLFRLQDLQL
ncbi:hypothetical protein QBC39DRAFT_139410 [Podospora conica]|nr:hypothetical protein QBC39DRAFT_139410 [Schizothecium conicum]